MRNNFSILQSSYQAVGDRICCLGVLVSYFIVATIKLEYAKEINFRQQQV